MAHKDKALGYFENHFHCSQAVLAAFADECKLSEELALKMGACFGSGMRQAEVCGACTGALMVLGALYGQHDKDNLESRRIANEVNDKMMERFAKECGSYSCKELLKCDISIPEGVSFARENNLFSEYCPKVVEKAVEILEQIIAEQASE